MDSDRLSRVRIGEPLSLSPRIFLSYRRDDAAGHAGRLYDSLAERFGEENVFMDVDAIDLGADFQAAVDRAVASSDVMISVIGREWTTAADASGRRRLEDPHDFVRLELESALARDVTIIPACVEGAVMPSSRDLPPSLSALVRRQGIELRDVAWRDDVQRLIRQIEQVQRAIGGAGSDVQHPVEPDTARRVPARYLRVRKLALPLVLSVAVLGGAAAGLIIALGGDGANARHRLEVVVPVAPEKCEPIEPPMRNAYTLECALSQGVSVDYTQFASVANMNDLYAGADPGDLPPDSGCNEQAFRGVRLYFVDGRTVGRYACFFDSQNEAQLVWIDERATVGAEASVYDTLGRPGSEKGLAGARLLLDKWKCCLQLKP